MSLEGAIYDLITKGKNYAGGAAQVGGIVDCHAPGAGSLLDVGCGTGAHLGHLRTRFTVKGLDFSAAMLDIARDRLGDVPLHQGDPWTFRLGRTFDVVTCLSGSIGYMRTTDELAEAARTLTHHVRDGGLLVVEPWITPDVFSEGDLVCDIDVEGPVKFSRMYQTRLDDRLSVYDIHYVAADADGVRSFRQYQELGLFTRAEYEAAFASAGLTLVPEPQGVFTYGLFVALKSVT